MALTVTTADPGTISGVTTAPNYTGTLQVGGGDATLNGPLQGGDGYPIQGGADPTGYTGVLGASYTVDPYAGTKWGSTAGRNSAINTNNVSRDNLAAGAGTQYGSAGTQYDQSARNLITGAADTQAEINTNRAKNSLNLRRSMTNIAGGVRQGLRSGAVSLANTGASDSGAAQAMADAYGKIGNEQVAGAENEKALADEALQVQQTKLDRDLDQGIIDLQTWKVNTTNNISQKLSSDFATLNAQAQADGLPGIDTGVANTLLTNALTTMAAVDARTAGERANIRAWDKGAVEAEAARMDKTGVSGTPAFSTGGADLFQPGQMSNTGGATSGAPITQIPLTVRRRF